MDKFAPFVPPIGNVLFNVIVYEQSSVHGFFLFQTQRSIGKLNTDS